MNFSLHPTIDFFAYFFFNMLKYALPTLFALIAISRFTSKFSSNLLAKLEKLSKNKTARTILFIICIISCIVIAIAINQISIVETVFVGMLCGIFLAILIIVVCSYTCEYISKKEEE